jgi:hypothetical protein
MDTGERICSPQAEFGHGGSPLGMGTALRDYELGCDLVIEDLDEMTTALTPFSTCPSPLVHRRPAITGHVRPHGRLALVTV